MSIFFDKFQKRQRLDSIGRNRNRTEVMPAGRIVAQRNRPQREKTPIAVEKTETEKDFFYSRDYILKAFELFYGGDMKKVILGAMMMLAAGTANAADIKLPEHTANALSRRRATGRISTCISCCPQVPTVTTRQRTRWFSSAAKTCARFWQKSRNSRAMRRFTCCLLPKTRNTAKCTPGQCTKTPVCTALQQG